MSCLESCPCAAADVVVEALASDGPAGERVNVHDAANKSATVSNANLDVTMEAAAATGVHDSFLARLTRPFPPIIILIPMLN